MHSSWERTALQKAAEHAVVRGTLKTSGIFATIFGLLSVFVAIQPPLDVLLLAVGAALALVGLWNLTNPSPFGLALMAGALVMVGLYNVGSGFLDAAAGHRPFVGWQVLGVWQVMWGVQGFGRYQRFKTTFEAAVPKEDLARARGMIGELRKANAKKTPDVIDMATTGFTPKLIRMRLMPDLALVLLAAGDDVRVVGREDLSIAIEGEPKRMVKVRIRMGSEELKGAMSSEYYQRFRAWKDSLPVVQLRAA